MKVSLIQENFIELSIDLFDPGCLRILGAEFRKAYLEVDWFLENLTNLFGSSIK